MLPEADIRDSRYGWSWVAAGGIALSATVALGQGPNQAELSARAFEERVAELASDAMEGRAPGTRGGRAAAARIAEWFAEAGLEPLEKGFFMEVPLLGRVVDPTSDRLILSGVGAEEQALKRASFAATTELASKSLEVEAPLVFAGHGITSVASGWDDYRGLEVGGAVVAVRSGIPDRASELPGGEHGWLARDEAKRKRARQLGARGVVYLLEADAEETVRRTREHWRHEQLQADWSGSNESPLALVAWVDADLLPATAPTARLRAHLRQESRRFQAPNVVGLVPGSDPSAGAVLLTAHYDAYGIGPADGTGDPLYNGALDNATGVAALVELARWFARREPRLERTLVFIATTAEEQGSLGASYYAAHPVLPLSETVVQLNLDGINPIAPTDDFIVFPSAGLGPEVHRALEAAGGAQGMELAEQVWQESMHFSFDTEPFLLRGVVGVTLWQGSRYRGLTPDELEARRRRFGPIHTPRDEWPERVDRAAITQHLELYRAAVELFAGKAGAPRPSLRPGHPFQGWSSP